MRRIAIVAFMATFDQKHFLSRVRQALGFNAAARRPWSELIPEQDADRLQAMVQNSALRSHAKRLELLDTLAQRCRQSNIGIHIGQRPHESARQIATLVKSRCGNSQDVGQVILWQHPLLERLHLTRRLSEEVANVTLNTVDGCNAAPPGAVEERHRDRFRGQVFSACIGITSADYCLADSATLVMTTHPGRPRLVSLVPPVHIAVISLGQILSDLQELYTILADAAYTAGEGITNCMTFISGPSTTRDIEAIPVPGAQGPRELHIVVISENPGNGPPGR